MANQFADTTDLVELVFQTVGAATSPRMWDDNGVFQEHLARKIAEDCLQKLREGIPDGKHRLVWAVAGEVTSGTQDIKRHAELVDALDFNPHKMLSDG